MPQVPGHGAEALEKEMKLEEIVSSWDFITAVVFMVLMGVYFYSRRAKLELQKILWPFIYMILYRTKLGLSLMDRIASKYREQVKLFGLVSIGLAFAGMAFITIAIVFVFVSFIFQPQTVDPGVYPVLPFTEVPGLGYISFWHWIIAIFLLAVIHEFAHGVVARAYDIPVKSSGFAIFGLLLPILPAAFVEPDEEKTKKKSDVIQYSIFAAGPAANLIIGYVGLMIVMSLLQPYVYDPIEDRLTYADGFTYTVTNMTGPAALAKMPNTSIIIGLNGKEIKSYTDFQLYMGYVKPGDTVDIVTKEGTYSIETGANPADVRRPLLGISIVSNKRSPNTGYESYVGAYRWLEELLYKFFLLNLLIGLANCLPIMIVDGGRMSQIVIGKFVTDEKKATKIWMKIGTALLVIILLLLGATLLLRFFR
jgi:membrane-associated protease RseP (regulator of RpoE activity)